ncbi:MULTISPECIES: dihydrolipoamide acetyltransferase family protein [Ramlibacter]|uniref:Dihydrolipoamide acetyltransferase component of pyruvate dehydrogenase complex n=1 Tax=Ramlibacter pinisoli TaxID=2682844 RepID=A0A6N8IQJ6_9BURK|nr:MULTISPECIES: dihydrolipoamide acetyltransferase family protein [Ramlibacter]MBA2964203.1 2-oxo acid dehydrogenase subunit E2 [Ramlibacter sp. CGMCC 1.13660]MVQ29169.1 2-oxo acid dehydrogenase subunit E2 [Ramlibacter pinisoli]
MGIYAIKMPDIGEGIAEVELVEWRIQPGDAVQEDQIVADVMTDKATVEIPSPVSGTVLELGGKPGELMAVGAELVRIEVAGEGNVKAGAPAARAAAAAPVRETATDAGAHAAPTVAASKVDQPPRSPVPNVRPAVEGTIQPSPPKATPVPQRAPGDKPIASPAVRRRAWELGIELQFVHGSGPAGRIEHADLDVYLASRGQPLPVGGGARLREKHGEQQVPVIGLRRKIAQKMQEAKRRIPHFSYVEEIDVTELEALRAKLNARHGTTRGKLTVLPFIARAVVLAVAEFPQMNARFDDDAGVVTRHEAVHLGVAAQTDAGLLVPVLRHAEAMDVWACAKEIARLAEAARSGKAGRDELAGSTITISSLGPLGGIVTTPVINHPEVAIIGVNRIVERPVFQGDAVVRRSLMNLSSSFDHRVVDGMDAAQFVQAIRALLESPALLFVE